MQLTALSTFRVRAFHTLPPVISRIRQSDPLADWPICINKLIYTLQLTYATLTLNYMSLSPPWRRRPPRRPLGTSPSKMCPAGPGMADPYQFNQPRFTQSTARSCRFLLPAPYLLGGLSDRVSIAETSYRGKNSPSDAGGKNHPHPHFTPEGTGISKGGRRYQHPRGGH